MSTMAGSKVQTASSFQGFELKERLKKLPMPVQVLINLGFVGLLAIDLAMPDVLPFVDEILFSWLAYTGISASFASWKERKQLGDGSAASSLDVRAQQGMELDGIREVDDELLDATRREMEALDSPF
jgi:hypothetical protein